MKRILVVVIVIFLASTLLYTPATRGQSSTLDNTLVVYVGAHPDDIDIAISGSLYKHDAGTHPILWLIVTDGGADIEEYQYESNASRNWIAKDAQFAINWDAPDGSNVIRQFFSADLAKKRCGGYFDGLSWKDEPASHDSTFGVEYDWRTRVSNLVGANIEKIQLSYLELSNPSKLLMYPDGALANAESAFTNSIAQNVAIEIDKYVEFNGYQKSLLKICSHAPEEVCMNANEHPDHIVTGNAVRQAIDLLHSIYGFGEIDAKWFTIYNPINPKSGYLRVDEDISQQQTQKSELAKASWETDVTHSRSINYTWNDYPNNPGQYEHYIAYSYYPGSPSTQPSASPAPLSLETIATFFNDIIHQYPLEIVIGIIVIVVVVAIAIIARRR
jgi:hypothetical protein